jgi:hypothetical protein
MLGREQLVAGQSSHQFALAVDRDEVLLSEEKEEVERGVVGGVDETFLLGAGVDQRLRGQVEADELSPRLE